MATFFIRARNSELILWGGTTCACVYVCVCVGDGKIERERGRKRDIEIDDLGVSLIKSVRGERTAYPERNSRIPF